MKGTNNNFLIKYGNLPSNITAYNEIKKGENLPLVYDINNNCVGVVLKSLNRENHTYGHAEICFYEKYYDQYGKWHKMYEIYKDKKTAFLYSKLMLILVLFETHEYEVYIDED